MSVLTTIKHHLSQIPGWCTRRKLVVIESDDWGSIRMPSREVYEKLFKEGYRVDLCHFSHYDSLETEEDLNLLFETLRSVKDKNGNPAILTANSVVANPDFDKIKASDFNEYHFELTTVSYKHQKGCENSYGLIMQGIEERLWKPQFHGREHLNVIRWMKALKEGDEVARACFDQKHFSLTKVTSPKVKARYMDAFANAEPTTLSYEKKAVNEGMEIFESLYGFRSESVIAPCYIWRPILEEAFAENGIKYIQGLALQQIPINDDPIKVKTKFHHLGEKNKLGQRYLIRNAFFEPYKGGDWVSECLKRIKIAFRCHKPAVISSHRLNFIGAIEPSKRDIHLKELKTLLYTITKLWPDVEFISSDQLGHIIEHK